MTFSLIASVANTVLGITPTAAIDTTGANLIVIAGDGGGTNSGTTGTPTDVYGNTYTPLTDRNDGANVDAKLFYCSNPTVGSAHTFTPGTAIDDLVAAAFSGAANSSPFDKENGAASLANTTVIDTQSITTSVDGCLVVTSLAGAGTGVGGVLNTIIVRDYGGGAYRLSGGMAWTEKATAGSIGVTWGWSTEVLTEQAATIASFLPATGVSRVPFQPWSQMAPVMAS